MLYFQPHYVQFSCYSSGTFGTYTTLPYPVLAWSIQLRAYAMPSVPVPPITLLTDMVTRCRLLAAHGDKSCLSVRTEPLTATGAPFHRPLLYHTMGVLPSTQPVATPYHTIHHTIPGTVQLTGGYVRQMGYVRASTFDVLCSHLHH